MSGSGLHMAVVGAGGKGVACLTTVHAETSLEPTAAFLEGERPTRPTSTIQIHRNMLVGGRGRKGLARLGRFLVWVRELLECGAGC